MWQSDLENLLEVILTGIFGLSYSSARIDEVDF